MLLFDRDRSALAGAYSPNAVLSVRLHKVPGGAASSLDAFTSKFAVCNMLGE